LAGGDNPCRKGHLHRDWAAAPVLLHRCSAAQKYVTGTRRPSPQCDAPFHLRRHYARLRADAEPRVYSRNSRPAWGALFHHAATAPGGRDCDTGSLRLHAWTPTPPPRRGRRWSERFLECDDRLAPRDLVLRTEST